MARRVERQSNEAVVDHRQDQRNAGEVKRGLGQHGLARQAWWGDAPCHADGPFVVDIAGIGECYQETSIGEPHHDGENPFLVAIRVQSDRPGEAQVRPCPYIFTPCPLQLIADQPPLRHAHRLCGPFDPLREVALQPYCQRVTHRAET